jgi:ankyrin repeat protein
MTPLHLAAAHGLPGSCKLLLTATGERALKQRAAGLTPLYLAVAAGQVGAVKVMLQHCVDFKTVQGEDLLHAALMTDTPVAPGCKRDSVAMLKYLLSEGLDVNARSSEGIAPLFAATVHSNTTAVQLLLEHGADSNLKNADGSTPLTTACRAGHSAIVELLLQHGADTRVTVEAGGYLEVTVLMIAVHSGHIDVAKLLLARGADVNAVDQGRRNALTFAAAAQSNRAALVKLLLQHGADPKLRSKLGETALLSAVVSGDAECAQLLVIADADVNARCGLALPSTAELAESAGVEGMTVTTVRGVVTAVLADGSQQHLPAALRDAIADEMSKTILMAADTPAVVKDLLAAGADVHRTTDQGNTCLHTAARNYPASVICLLIKAGVSLRAVNCEGKTAAAVARDQGNTLAAALLNRAAKDV